MTLHLPFAIEIVLRRPEFLWLVVIVPVLLLLVWREGRTRKRVFQNDPQIQLHIDSAQLPKRWHRFLWWVGVCAVIALLSIILAIPEQALVHWRKVYGMVRITFLIDSSLSAVRAEDIKPNRLAAEKAVMRDFVNALWFDAALKGNYAVALIPFAGAAQPFYLPFTTSREQILSNLEAISEQTITKKGTSIGSALRAYDELLLSRPAREKNTIDIAILISDGGKEEGKGSELSTLPALMKALVDPYRMAVTLGEQRIVLRSKKTVRNVVVNTVGVGKVEIDEIGNRIAVPVPLIIRDKAGNFHDYYREDEKNPNSPVLQSRLDEDILRDIAKMGRGSYIHFSEKEKLLEEFKALVLKNRQETGRISDVSYDALRLWFLIPAFCICVILFGYVNPYLRLMRRFRTVRFRINK